jgi:hypothetical protein
MCSATICSSKPGSAKPEGPKFPGFQMKQVKQ